MNGDAIRRRHSLIVLVSSLTLVASPALAQGERPTEEDLKACEQAARAQVNVPAYSERAPASPFPSRISGVGPWTGPVTSTPPPRRGRRPPPPPTTSGEFGAGGSSQQSTSEPGPEDARYREAFDACMRARGF